MAYRQETTKYGKVREDQPAQEPEFSLEDILAEYGSSREQKLMETVETAAAIAENDQPDSREHEADQEKPAVPLPEPESVAPEEEPLPEENPAQEEPSASKAQTDPEERPAPEDLPPPPRPITLEEVVGSTVSAVMEENAIRAEAVQKQIFQIHLK